MGFEDKYKGSFEELKCIKDAHFKYKGAIERIPDSVLCWTIEHEQRFRNIITKLISENQLAKVDALVN